MGNTVALQDMDLVLNNTCMKKATWMINEVKSLKFLLNAFSLYLHQLNSTLGRYSDGY